MRLGGYALCAWSSSQKVVALSSCESEYYILVRCAGEAIGLRETLKEIQLNDSVRLWTDATAARGLALRTGGGQIKHMQAKYYWLQECIKAGILTVEKIRGTVNPADLMTKHLDGTTMRAMCGPIDPAFETGGSGGCSAEASDRQRLCYALCEPSCGGELAASCSRRAE